MKILLTDVCDFQGGTQPSKDEWINEITDGYIRMLQIRDFTQPEKNNIQYVKYTSKLKTCEKNDILIGRYGASVGKILTGLSGAYNVALIKTIPDLERLDVRYLFYYFNSQYFQQFIKNVGSRAAQAGFNKGDLNSVHIPLISLEEQRKIAEILDKVSDLIAKRKHQFEKLDLLVKSKFVEMFGDPVANPKNWITKSLFEIGICKNGMNFRYDDSGVEIHCLGVGDFKDLSVMDNMSILPVISLNEMPTEDYLLKDGDIVFVRSNGNKELVGRCLVVYPKDAITTFSGFCIRFRKTYESITIPYLLQVLKSDSIRKNMAGRGANIQNLNQQILNSLVIPIPPIELQNQFADFVQQTEKTKTIINQSLDKLETLKKALMQEYFM